MELNITLYSVKSIFNGFFLKLLLLTSTLLTGQNPTSVLYEYWANNNWQKETRTFYSYDSNNYLTNTLGQTWLSNSSIWENNFQTNYTNNSDGTINQSITQIWDSGTSTWNDGNRNLYIYNGSKQILTQIFQIWTGNWENSNKTTNTYDGSGYLINSLYQTWEISVWKNQNQINFTNNLNGKIQQSVYQFWDLTENWMNVHRTTYIYNGENKEIQSITENWDGIFWVNTFKQIKTYDVNNYLVNNLSQFWDLISSSWITDGQSLFSNDFSGNILQVTSQIWDSGLNTWINDSRLTFDYTLDLKDFIKDKAFVISPNPFSDIITVNLKNFSNKKNYFIIDATGRIIQNGELNNELNSIDLSRISKGIYMFQIEKNNLKIIKN